MSADTLPMRVHPARKRGKRCPTCSAPAGEPCRVATPRTTRNRRVSCAADAAEGCGFACYLSRKQLQRAGVWTCPCCGDAPMLPVDPDDASLVLSGAALEAHPAIVEHQARAQSVAHGQAWTGNYASTPTDARTAELLEIDRRARARSNRLGALKPAPEPMPF